MRTLALAALLLTTACTGATIKLEPGDAGYDAAEDATIDAGTDAGMDAAEAGPSCACTSGPCCDGCNVKPSGTLCGTGVHTQECTGAKSLESGTFYQTCDGVTATGCKGAWTMDTNTAAPETCIGSASSCVSRSATFPWNACCSSAQCP